MSAVKFGTDGWRGIIADDFTYANVRVAAAAIAHYVLEHEDAKAGVCIGWDTRFGSQSFAKVVAEVLSEAGIPAVEFGPSGAGHHGPDEWVSLISLARYRRALGDFVRSLPMWLEAGASPEAAGQRPFKENQPLPVLPADQAGVEPTPRHGQLVTVSISD